MPFVRLDGYYLLSDLTGVPDLFARIKPTLKAAVPGQEPEPAAAALKPWVRVVVTLWILALVPLLGISLVMAAISAPRIIATAWDSLLVQFQLAGDAVDEGNWLGLADGIVSSIALALPALAVVYSLTRIAKKTATAAWKRTDGRPIGRSAVAFGGVALLAGLAWLWWPNGEYRPIQPGERGTVTDGLVVARDLSTGRPGLTEERQEELDGAPLRSEEEETPAQDPTTTTSTTTPATTSTTVTDDEDAPATTTTTERRASTTTTTTEASTTTSTSTSTTTTTTTTTTPETSP
jgi:putative peptide zinc metalloprotease protein